MPFLAYTESGNPKQIFFADRSVCQLQRPLRTVLLSLWVSSSCIFEYFQDSNTSQSAAGAAESKTIFIVYIYFYDDAV